MAIATHVLPFGRAGREGRHGLVGWDEADGRSADARSADAAGSGGGRPGAAAADDGVELIELPDAVGEADAAGSPAGAVLSAYARRGFADGRRRGFREAVALASLAVEELIADRSLGDVPPSVLRRWAAALTGRLAEHAPAEGYVEGGLGI